MRLSLPISATLVLLFTAACPRSEVDQDTATTEPTLGLDNALQADLIASNLGFLWSTDLSPDMVILREAGTAFTYLSSELSIWSQRVAGGQSASLDDCMSQSNTSTSNGVSTTQITLSDCFVGANRDRRLDGEFLIAIEDREVYLTGDWNFKIASVDLNGTFQAYWKNINATNRPDATFSLNAVYDGNTYNHRTFSVAAGEVKIPSNYETPCKFSIPTSGSEGLGASLSWDNREDRLDFGLILKNAHGSYKGEFWGEYTSTSGQVVPITNGRLEETSEHDLTLTYSASAQTETQAIDLSEIVQTWGNQTAAFDADLSFSYEASGQATLGAHSTSLDLKAYTVTPLSLRGENQRTTLNGAIESALFFQNEQNEAQEIWVFGNCLELTQSRDLGIGSSGTCTFNNADGAHIALHFSDKTSSDGWLLVEKAPKEWICRNLESGEVKDLGTSETAPSGCLD